jgi:hypothetical protein
MKKYTTGLALALGCGLLVVTTGAAADKKETKPYPLQTCVVSDEKLGSMGTPYVFTNDPGGCRQGNKTVRLPRQGRSARLLSDVVRSMPRGAATRAENCSAV